VMPVFSPVPDRVEQVRRRARAARERLMWTGSAAAVLVVAAGAGVVAAQTSPDQPAVAAVSAACDLANGSPFDIRSSPLVPVAAAKVTLCIYPEPLPDRPPQSGDPGAVPPTGSSVVPLPGSAVVPVPQRAGGLVGTKVQQDADGAIGRKVNAMPKPGPCATSSGNYRLVFEYENRAPTIVRLQDRCGHPILREELLRDGDVLGWLDRMGMPYLVLGSVELR
jgi:hypothetical protein